MLRLFTPTFWFGPLFRVELIRLARRGLHNPLRWGLGLILLLTLFIFYSNWFPHIDPVAIALLGSAGILWWDARRRFDREGRH